MNYLEARMKALTVPWKTVPCGTPNCWCLMIYPDSSIFFDDEEEYYIIGSGGVHSEIANHIVACHNNMLNKS